MISRPPIKLPSDVNQYKVFSYDPKAEDLADHLEHYLEGILLQVGIDADRAVRKRTTLPELHRWLIDVTKKLRERAKDTYVDDSGLWEVSRIVSFLPTRCTFWLRHKFDEAEKKAAPDTGQEGVAIECGAFYADWNRRESPFRISVKRLAPGAREVEVESFPVQPAEPLEVVRDDAVFAAFEQKLDELVSRLTPGLSRNAPLAKRLNVMQKALAEIRTVDAETVPGLVPRQPQAAKWGVDGCEWEFKAAADDSLLVFAVDFRRWEQSSGECPFWVRFQPRSTKDQPAIEEWVNRLQQRVDGIEVGQGSWTFPLVGKPEQTVKEKFCGLASDILERYRPAAKEAEAGSQPAEGVVGPVVA